MIGASYPIQRFPRSVALSHPERPSKTPGDQANSAHVDRANPIEPGRARALSGPGTQEGGGLLRVLAGEELAE